MKNENWKDFSLDDLKEIDSLKDLKIILQKEIKDLKFKDFDAYLEVFREKIEVFSNAKMKINSIFFKEEIPSNDLLLKEVFEKCAPKDTLFLECLEDMNLVLKMKEYSFFNLKIKVREGKKVFLFLEDESENSFFFSRHLFLEEKASLTFFFLKKNKALLEAHMDVQINHLSSKSHLHEEEMLYGVGKNRHIFLTTLKKESSLKHMASSFLQKGSSFDFLPVQEHLEGSSFSSLKYHSILEDETYGFFRGHIHIPQGAAFCEAEQNHKNLLLGPQSFAKASPTLLVIPSQVKVKHGSASGALQKKHLQYLLAKGFSLEEAQETIIQGFKTEPFSQKFLSYVLL